MSDGRELVVSTVDGAERVGKGGPIWQAIINPARAVEVRAWARKFPGKAQAIKGGMGEGIMHWACMSDMGLVIDLLAIGLDVNEKDAHGKTPWDWLSDRLWMACVLDRVGIPQEGKMKMRAQTEELGLVLWQYGARPGGGVGIGSGSAQSVFHGSVWVRGGAWSLVETIHATLGADGLRGWPLHSKSALHDWPLSGADEKKHRHLERMLEWGLDVDERDANGRTPLWYAVDAGIARPEYENILSPSISGLLCHGADPDALDYEGVSPRMGMDATRSGVRRLMSGY